MLIKINPTLFKDIFQGILVREEDADVDTKYFKETVDVSNNPNNLSNLRAPGASNNNNVKVNTTRTYKYNEIINYDLLKIENMKEYDDNYKYECKSSKNNTEKVWKDIFGFLAKKKGENIKTLLYKVRSKAFDRDITYHISNDMVDDMHCVFILANKVNTFTIANDELNTFITTLKKLLDSYDQ